MGVRIGIFSVPDATDPAATVDRILAADRSGLDVVGIQDHPYQPRFLEAMGGPRRTPKESVDALDEAITILRAFWSGDRSVSFEGEHHHVEGAHPGPPPARAVGIWLGAYGPRMLRLTGARRRARPRRHRAHGERDGPRRRREPVG